ncbi:MAG: leucine-rich repeat domain-containing protein, partial [Clostridia bacterium]|nr:leucine-rich repeat domain-containing protein [Clostridia bacterium]
MKSIRKFLLLCLSLALGVALLFALNSCGDDHEHDFTYRTTVVNPDCQSGGYTCNFCECGAMEEGDYIPPRGHIPEVVPGRPATCFESGLTDGSVCASCGQTLSEQQPISPSHTVVTDEAVEATCKEQGLTEGSHCSVCDTVIVSQYPTSKTGHKFDGDSCEVCGCEYYTEGLAFTYVQETDSYKITGSPLVDEVYIPSTYEGKSVTVIGDGSFRNNSAVKTVHIPDTVTTIEKEAFMFSGLESLLLPATVTSIGEYAFYGGVETVYYGGTVADWCKLTFTVSGENPMMFADSFYFLDSEGDKLYEGNKYSELTALVIPEGVSTISNYAFCSLSSLMSVTFSDDVESIGKFAFAECQNIHT